MRLLVLGLLAVGLCDGQCTGNHCENEAGDGLSGQIAHLSQMVRELQVSVKTLADRSNSNNNSPSSSLPRDKYKDCWELLRAGETRSGVYEISVEHVGVTVICTRMEEAGWFSSEGNRLLHILTTLEPQELRVDLADFTGNQAYAKYSTFCVGDPASHYNLTVTGFTGTAGNSLETHSGHGFTTKDNDVDDYGPGNCGQLYHGAWWYTSCHTSNLNGQYTGHNATHVSSVTWFNWHNEVVPLRFTEMKIRPLPS